MNRLPGIVLLVLVAGCGGFEVPPVELGSSGGARLMTGGGKNPEEVYENAYAQLTKQHLIVRRSLEPRSRNLYGAAASMQSILDAFATMRSLVSPADQARMDPFIAQYVEWKRDIERDTYGSFLSDFERAERRVKEAFDIGRVELVAALPAASAPKETVSAPAPKPAEKAPPRENTPVIPSDMAVPPPRTSRPVAEVPAPKPAEKAPDAPPAAAPVASGRIYFKAWKSSHLDLVEAYKANPRPDCRAPYDDVIESLRLLKATLGADRAQKLQIYMDFYAGLNEKTKTFKALPDKTTEQEILGELHIISENVRREFNPDK